nr:hypothetical protein [Tanacetum cinerariifolium]
MASTRASTSKASKKLKINIIPPKQLFVDLTRDDTKTLSPTLQLSSPSAPNAPSKTPSTKDTSSSLIDYTPKSPTISSSPFTNVYLNLQATQENASIDITLTLTPITPLDVQFDTPSPSPPIFDHSIPWNLFEAHEDSCLCCVHNPIHSHSTPTPAPTTDPTTTSVPILLDFSSLFGFDQRVSTLEKEISQFKQVDHSAQILASIKSQIPAIVDEHLTKRIRFATQTALQPYTAELEKKAQEEKDIYIDLIEKSIKDIIKDKVKSQLSQILPKEVSDFATSVIQTSLTRFELKKILLDKIQKSKSYTDHILQASQGSKSKDSTSSSSKGTKSQPKSSGKSVQAEETVFEVANTEMSHDQGGDLGNKEDQPSVKTGPKHDWFKKPKRPSNPDPVWNDGKSIDFKPPQTWINKIAQTEKPPLTFDEMIRTPIDFSAYVMNNLKIDNLTQEILVGPAFNLLKGTCKSFVKLEYNFKECYKAITDRLDWNNPEGHEYPFDLSKPLPLIEAQGRQVVPANYFFNNYLKYLKGGSSSRKYTNSTTKTKADKYDNIEGIEDMVPMLWSPVKVAYKKNAMWGIAHWSPKQQKFYGYASNRKSTHDVFSKRRIIAVTHVKVMKLMRLDELFKFSDGTVTSVKTVFHDITNNPRMEYLPKRRWSNSDKKRSRIMIKAIDHQLFERRLMRNLEKFVGGRDYETGLRLLERTI